MYRPESRKALLMAATIFAVGVFPVAAQENKGQAVQVVSPFGNVERAVPKYPDAGSLGIAARSKRSSGCTRPNALNTFRILKVNTRDGFAVGLKTYPQSLNLGEKEVVLTFDDGPLPSSTGQVLDALREQCVKATFFLVGKNAQAHPDLVRREIADGHTIGHHSFSHPEKTLRGITEAAAKAEIIDGISAVQVASGQAPYKSGRPRTPFFRFPGFADTPEALEMLNARGIGVFGTDIWASDWHKMSPAMQLHLVMQRLEQEGRGIILFHDTKPQTAAMLPQFLAELKAKGYRVVHIVPGGEERTPLREAPPAWTSETKAILDRVMPRLLHAKAGDAKAKHEM
jgi:peptidoglycan-N-acetylglucosamine deacetylase